ncbi:uncharacterized protein [Montipora foliosa]|uniref:uncharacterized protein isoform X2 n=1 Tax=Montipora foliosa TaxID=591990 RepID=UPI0035F1E5AA
MVGVVRSLGLAKIILCIFLTAWPQTSTVFTHAKNAPNFYTNGWAIRVEGGIETAKRIARSHGFERVEPIGTLENFFHLEHAEEPRRSRRSADERTEMLMQDPQVMWAEQQHEKIRVKRGHFHDRMIARGIVPRFNDPLWDAQWYLDDKRVEQDLDIHVLPVWNQGITGKGVVVTILDDVVDHGQCGCEDVISEIWSSSSPVVRDLADGQQQCAGEDAGRMEISEIWTSLSPAEGNSVQCDDDHSGEEPERELAVMGNQMLSVANNLMETQQPLPQVNDSNQLEDIQLIARARAVGIQYEFAHPGVQESEDDRKKESGEIKGEYQMEREGCVQSLVIYHHLHLQDQVSSRMKHTVLYVRLRSTR